MFTVINTRSKFILFFPLLLMSRVVAAEIRCVPNEIPDDVRNAGVIFVTESSYSKLSVLENGTSLNVVDRYRNDIGKHHSISTVLCIVPEKDTAPEIVKKQISKLNPSRINSMVLVGDFKPARITGRNIKSYRNISSSYYYFQDFKNTYSAKEGVSAYLDCGNCSDKDVIDAAQFSLGVIRGTTIDSGPSSDQSLISYFNKLHRLYQYGPQKQYHSCLNVARGEDDTRDQESGGPTIRAFHMEDDRSGDGLFPTSAHAMGIDYQTNLDRSLCHDEMNAYGGNAQINESIRHLVSDPAILTFVCLHGGFDTSGEMESETLPKGGGYITGWSSCSTGLYVAPASITGPDSNRMIAIAPLDPILSNEKGSPEGTFGLESDIPLFRSLLPAAAVKEMSTHSITVTFFGDPFLPSNPDGLCGKSMSAQEISAYVKDHQELNPQVTSRSLTQTNEQLIRGKFSKSIELWAAKISKNKVGDLPIARLIESPSWQRATLFQALAGAEPPNDQRIRNRLYAQLQNWLLSCDPKPSDWILETEIRPALKALRKLKPEEPLLDAFSPLVGRLEINHDKLEPLPVAALLTVTSPPSKPAITPHNEVLRMVNELINCTNMDYYDSSNLRNVSPEDRKLIFPLLINLVADSSRLLGARNEAAKVLKLGGAESVESAHIISEVLKNDRTDSLGSDWTVKKFHQNLLELLASWNPQTLAAVPGLPAIVSRYLQHPKAATRAAALTVLGKIQTHHEIDIELIALLNHDNRSKRIEAAHKLQSLAPKMDESLALVVWTALENEPNVSVRNALTEAVASMGTKLQVELSTALNDTNEKVRTQGLLVLSKMGQGAEFALPQLIQLAKLHEEYSITATKILGQLGAAAVPSVSMLSYRLIAEKMNTPEMTIIIHTLGSIGPGAQSSLPLLKSIAAAAEKNGRESEELRAELRKSIQNIEAHLPVSQVK